MLLHLAPPMARISLLSAKITMLDDTTPSKGHATGSSLELT